MKRIPFVFRALCFCLLALAPIESAAQGRVQLGYGRLINNDFLGDLKDRGQTGSYVSSRIFGRAWGGALPRAAGEFLEFRLQADIKAPDDLVTPAPGDRPFAGSVTLGLHTHYQQSGFEIAMGGEIVAIGPQTRLDQFQTALHDGLGVAPPSAVTRAAQIGDAFHPGVVVEMGRPFRIGETRQFRPFIEARAGVETLVRAGFDYEIGALTQNDVMVRDGITGQRYRTILPDGSGLGFVVGADMALVKESAYLPAARGFSLTDRRDRFRTGLHWQNKRSHGFFGVTYLGKEYTTQAEPQVVGSIRLALKF